MPHRNIWVRKEDLDKWEKISNKSEWLHEQLSETTPIKSETPPRSSYGQSRLKTTPETPQTPNKKPIKTVTYKPTSNWGA